MAHRVFCRRGLAQPSTWPQVRLCLQGSNRGSIQLPTLVRAVSANPSAVSRGGASDGVGLGHRRAVRCGRMAAQRGLRLPLNDGTVEVDLRDSTLAFSWPCACCREALGEGCKAELGTPRPCSPNELAAIAKLLEQHEIPKAKIWLSVNLSAFLFPYTSILGSYRCGVSAWAAQVLVLGVSAPRQIVKVHEHHRNKVMSAGCSTVTLFQVLLVTLFFT